MRYIYKYEFYRAAGVSHTTFYRFLRTRQKELQAMGVGVHNKLLPPTAVDYLCREFGVDKNDILE